MKDLGAVSGGDLLDACCRVDDLACEDALGDGDIVGVCAEMEEDFDCGEGGFFVLFRAARLIRVDDEEVGDCGGELFRLVGKSQGRCVYWEWHGNGIYRAPITTTGSL